jgi:hypothetical protein
MHINNEIARQPQKSHVIYIYMCVCVCVCTTKSQDIHKSLLNIFLIQFNYSFHIFLQIKTIVLQHWSERLIKPKFSAALLNPPPSNVSY